MSQNCKCCINAIATKNNRCTRCRYQCTSRDGKKKKCILGKKCSTTCNNDVWNRRNRCLEHTCAAKVRNHRCGNHIMMISYSLNVKGSKYCYMHTCNGNCNREVHEYRGYCDKCRCQNPIGCNNKRMKGHYSCKMCMAYIKLGTIFKHIEKRVGSDCTAIIKSYINI
jgi:hypothetical protein